MNRTRHSEEQIIAILKEHEAGIGVVPVFATVSGPLIASSATLALNSDENRLRGLMVGLSCCRFHGHRV